MCEQAGTVKRESLETLATVAVGFGKALMESGASARGVHEITKQVAVALGAERVDVRVGYASLTISAALGSESITVVGEIGAPGVNHRLYEALHSAADAITRGGSSVPEAREKLACAISHCKRHSGVVVAAAVGIACAAFGRLLGVDWVSVGPIFVASALGQIVRRQLGLRHVNVFLSTALVAFLSSALAGVGAKVVGSGALAKDMVVAVLLLVPGVPAFNAQVDILEGRPTLGSARAVWVAVILVFMTAGVWCARALLGQGS